MLSDALFDSQQRIAATSVPFHNKKRIYEKALPTHTHTQNNNTRTISSKKNSLRYGVYFVPTYLPLEAFMEP